MCKFCSRLLIFAALAVVLVLCVLLPVERAAAVETKPCYDEIALPMVSSKVDAVITNQWGSDAPPIMIFGHLANPGDVVTAPLYEFDEMYALRAFMDPLPVHSDCPGYGYYRDADMSIISRITLGNSRSLLLIRHAGGRGFHPGSEGYVQLVGSDYKILDVLSDQGPDNSYDGFGVIIDQPGGRIEWQGRADCPACACLESSTKIAIVVGQPSHNPLYSDFTSTRTTSSDVEASVTQQWGSDVPPLELFGQAASTGQVVTATLEETEEKYMLHAFEDSLPSYRACSGFGYIRDADKSVISRITLGQGRVLVLVRHNGARGSYPGSEGYVQLGNGWEIEKVVSAGNDNYSYGYGVRIDKANGTVEWQGRGSCPGCACHECCSFISVVAVKKKPEITSIEPNSGYIGSEVTVTGLNFGSTPGHVTFNNNIVQSLLSWSDSEIIVTVPPQTTTGPVVVHTTDMKESNGVTFSVEILDALVDLKPDTFNRKSKGKWITAYIELPSGFNVEDIDKSALAIVKINGVDLTEPVFAQDFPSAIGDYDVDGIPDLMVKFDRGQYKQLVFSGSCNVVVTGKLSDGNSFLGSDTVRVIH